MKRLKGTYKKASLALALLLCLVFTFNSGRASFHDLLQHSSESHQACTTETEADDCHLFVVHHVKSDNCNGNHDHFLKTEEKCFKCDYYKEKQQHYFSAAHNQDILQNVLRISFTGENIFISLFSFSCNSRGPPFIATT
ncbi:MAG: hypothetical protein H0W61_10450 [Bacteroidetes bacterium]|nr:hypothetical protein [Bacteroidota bacterium]